MPLALVVLKRRPGPDGLVVRPGRSSPDGNGTALLPFSGSINSVVGHALKFQKRGRRKGAIGSRIGNRDR